MLSNKFFFMQPENITCNLSYLPLDKWGSLFSSFAVIELYCYPESVIIIVAEYFSFLLLKLLK